MNSTQASKMDILYLLIPLALVVVLLATIAFRWATKSGQYDDLETPALRILMEETGVSRSAGASSPQAEGLRDREQLME